jgi:hypothetical protein
MNKPMRAIVEIQDGVVIVFPVAESDIEREKILDALRVSFGEKEAEDGRDG